MITPPTERWHILGAGAIGSLWACHLSLAGHPTALILRNASRLRSFINPIQLREQNSERSIKLTAELADNNEPIQRLLVTTKGYDTLNAIDSIQQRLSRSSLILLLQNGMGQQQRLADKLAEPRPDIAIYTGITTEGAYRESPQTLVHAGRGESWLGPINAAAQQRGAAALDSLLQLGLKTGYDQQIVQRLWQKLAINAAINGLTAIHGCQNGRLASDPSYRSQMQRLCNEVEQLAAALNQPLFNRPLIEVALEVATATAANYSSMLQDVRNQRPTEIDTINGYICRQAEQLGISTPHNQALVSTLASLQTTASEN